MTVRKLFIIIALFTGYNSFGQKAEINMFCEAVDSSIINNKHIVLHIIRHQTGYDSLRYCDRFYIDTSKGILVKTIYEFYFKGDGEYLEFYYRNNEIIKVNARHKLSERKFAGAFYFKSDNLIAHSDGEISPGKIVFDLQQILKTGNGYKNDSIEIIKCLKKKQAEIRCPLSPEID